MDQRIFELGLSVEATSLYLLLCPLAEGGAALTRQNVMSYWNASPAKLEAAAAELSVHGVIEQNDDGAWEIRPSQYWAGATLT